MMGFPCPTFYILVLTFYLAFDAIIADEPKVCIDALGCVEGSYRTGNEVEKYEAFMGVPFAKPPIGNLRFKNPVPADAWGDTLLAKEPRSDCLQNNYLTPTPYIAGEEDCLYLNIYRPAERSSEKLPVLFYIHSGGFFSGSPSPQFEGPEYFMDTNEVILVIPAYRLGPFGFLSTGDEHMPGNFGFKDQNLAMKWVKKYISAFGGDPTRVTIFGHSAGSISVNLHMLSPASKGLFRNAISMSGLANLPFFRYVDEKANAIQLANAAGITNASQLSSNELADVLRNMDALDLMQVTDTLKVWYIYPFLNYRTNVEKDTWPDAFLTTDVFKYLNNNPPPQTVPWIVGVTSAKGEGLAVALRIAGDPNLQADINKNFDEMLSLILEFPVAENPGKVKEIVKLLVAEYMAGIHELNEDTMDGFLELAGDGVFTFALYKIIEVNANTGSEGQMQTRIMKFNYRGPDSYSGIFSGTMKDFGTVHVDDTLYLFGTPLLVPQLYAKSTPEANFVKRYVGLYVEFAKTGLLFLVLCSFLVNIFAIRNQTPTVCLDESSCALGKYMLGYQTYIYEAFLGIPYAKPPIGDLRFKNPVKADLWTGTLSVQYPKQECIQKNYRDTLSGSEDCLYLNIYRPLHRKADNLPVLFYIHGGGFESGSASPLVEGPEYFMDTNEVILVVPAYRLGLFGFLSTGDEQMPGNFGFKDQNVALKWVHEYISAFGGDPTRVTIFGNSAGAISAHFHMLSPSSNGLFQNAILMSGAATTPLAQPLTNPKAQVIQLANAVGIENASEMSSAHLVKALQEIDPIQLLKANDVLKSNVGYPLILFRPTLENNNSVDSFLTQETFTSLAENPNSASVPWIIGNVPSKGEGLVIASSLVSDLKLQKEFNRNFDEMLRALLDLPPSVTSSADVINRLVSKYMGGIRELNDYTMDGFLELLGDAYFIYPTYKTIKISLGATETSTTDTPQETSTSLVKLIKLSRKSRFNLAKRDSDYYSDSDYSSNSNSDDYSNSDSDYSSNSDSDDYSDSESDDSSDSDSDDYSESESDDSSDSDSEDYSDSESDDSSDSDSDDYSDSESDDSSNSDSDDYSESDSSEEAPPINEPGAPGTSDNGGTPSNEPGAPGTNDNGGTASNEPGAPGTSDNGGTPSNDPGAPGTSDNGGTPSNEPGAPGTSDNGGTPSNEPGTPGTSDNGGTPSNEPGAPGTSDNGGTPSNEAGAPGTSDNGGTPSNEPGTPGTSDNGGTPSNEPGAPGTSDNGGTPSNEPGTPGTSDNGGTPSNEPGTPGTSDNGGTPSNEAGAPGTSDNGGRPSNEPGTPGTSDNGGTPSNEPGTPGTSDNGGTPSNEPEAPGTSDNGGTPSNEPGTPGTSDNGGTPSNEPGTPGTSDNGGTPSNEPGKPGTSDNGGMPSNEPGIPGTSANGGTPSNEPGAPGTSDNGGKPSNEPGAPGTSDNGGTPSNEPGTRGTPGTSDNGGVPTNEPGAPGTSDDGGTPSNEPGAPGTIDNGGTPSNEPGTPGTSDNGGTPSNEPGAPGTSDNGGRPSNEPGTPGTSDNGGAPNNEPGAPGTSDDGGTPSNEPGAPGTIENGGTPSNEPGIPGTTDNGGTPSNEPGAPGASSGNGGTPSSEPGVPGTSDNGGAPSNEPGAPATSDNGGTPSNEPGSSAPEKRTIKNMFDSDNSEKDSYDYSQSNSDNSSASDLDDYYNDSSDSVADDSSGGDSDDYSETDSGDSSLQEKRTYVSEYINDNITNLVGVIKFNYRGPYSYSKAYSGSFRNFGTVHGDDTLFLFKSPITFPFGYFRRSPEAALIKRYVRLYVEFAKTGKVTDFDNIDTCTMEPFEEGKCEYLSIVKDTEPLFQVDNNWNIERMRLWDDIYGTA